jgi:O-antigen/teichoic acid export membrane protein
VITSVSTLAKVIIQTVVLVVGWGIVGLAGSTIVINIITLALLAVLAGRLVPGLHRAKGGGLRLRSVEASRLRRQMVRASWPLMLNELLAMLFFKVDVSLMEPILGSEAVGLYSIGYKFLEALMIVPSMFTLALFPIISRQAAADREALARFYRLGTKILIILVLPAALVATVAARDMVLVLGGAEYLPGAAVVLRLVAWSMPFGWINSITQYVLIALDEQRYLTRAYAAVFLFTLISNLLLMPRFGYRASALLHIASELLLLIPFLIGVRRRLGDIGWWQVLGKPLLIATVSGACAFALLTIGRGPAVLGLAILYPLLIWRLNVLTSDERRILSPLFSRGRSAHP